MPLPVAGGRGVSAVAGDIARGGSGWAVVAELSGVGLIGAVR